MIAVDAMGGDHAPRLVIRGAYAAACKTIPIMLFGVTREIELELAKIDENWRTKPISIVDAPESISMSEEPVQAIRKKRTSSLVLAVESVKAGTCSAVISAGSSGALMAASALLLGRKIGVERPAIVGLLPGINGPVVCLDLGANVDCKPHYLVQFAQLGCDYARTFLGKNKPRVGLLSNGTESSKGNALTKEAFVLLETSGLEFVGNVEPGCIVSDKVDVVVSDGFTGNVMLKTIEATASLFQELIREKLVPLMHGKDEQSALGVQGFIKKINQLMQVQEQGGAFLAGVNGIVIVAHGNSDERAIENAIMCAHKHATMSSF